MKQPLPPVDPTRHLDTATLEHRFGLLAPSPRDEGSLGLLLARDLDRIRHTPRSVTLDAQGMPGDAWSRQEAPDPHEQLAVMNHAVAAVIANGQSLTLFGDNLFLDLDLSEENLPVGSRVQLGAATLEVTPKPHHGCATYAERFGADALGFISQRSRRHLRLRGIYLSVVEPGLVRIDDPVRVLSRPQS